MTKVFGITLGIGVLITAIVAWIFFAQTRGNHLEPAGKIGKVRSLNPDTNETLAIIDFSVTNSSDRDMVIRGVESDLMPSQGEKVEGKVVAASALDNVFRNYPALGGAMNAPLKARDVIHPHETTDRMVGIRFDIPDGTFDTRKGLVLRVEDITGPVLELHAK